MTQVEIFGYDTNVPESVVSWEEGAATLKQKLDSLVQLAGALDMVVVLRVSGESAEAVAVSLLPTVLDVDAP